MQVYYVSIYRLNRSLARLQTSNSIRDFRLKTQLIHVHAHNKLIIIEISISTTKPKNTNHANVKENWSWK